MNEADGGERHEWHVSEEICQYLLGKANDEMSLDVKSVWMLNQSVGLRQLVGCG